MRLFLTGLLVSVTIAFPMDGEIFGDIFPGFSLRDQGIRSRGSDLFF